MSAHRPFLRFAGVLVVAIVVAGGAHFASSAPTEAADSARAPATPQSPVSKPVAGSPDLADLTSPWLGYSVALPITWAFTGHVAPGDSATPHDTFMGPVPGSDATMVLVIGRSKDAPRRVVDHRIATDGATFAVTPPADMGDGAIALIAEATADGANWYVMAHMPDSAASRALFDQLVESIRVPDASFFEAGPAE